MSLDLKVLYEDEEVVVMKAPTDEELMELVYKYIRNKGRPVTWRELREEFSGTAGEDRLRRALSRLRRQGLVIDLGGGRYATPETPGALEEIEEKKRKRIMREAMSAEWARWRRRRSQQTN